MPSAAFQAEVSLLGIHAGEFGLIDSNTAIALQTDAQLVNVLTSTVWATGVMYNPGQVVTDPSEIDFWVAVAVSDGIAPQSDGAGLFWQALEFIPWVVLDFYNIGLTYDSGPNYDNFGLTYDS